MTSKVALKNQVVYVLIARLSLPAGAFLLLIALGQIGDKILGQYALATTYYFILQTLPLMGLMPFYMREVARSPENASDYFIVINSIALVAALSLNIAINFILPATSYPPEMILAIQLACISTIPGILAFSAEITLTALQKTKPIATIAAIENTVRLLVSLLILKLGYGIAPLMGVLLLTRTLALVCYLYQLKGLKLIKTPRFDGAFFKRSTKVMPVFLANTILCLLVSRLDYIALSFFESFENIGYYAIGYRLFEIFSIVINSVLSACFHIFARQHAVNWFKFRTSFRVFFPALILTLTLVTLTCTFLAPTYVKLLFSNQWPNAVFITQLFSALILLHGMDYSLSQMLNAMDRQRQDTMVLTLSVPVYAITLLAFIPTNGIIGAFLASATTMLFQTTLRLKYLITHTPKSHTPLLSYQESFTLFSLVIFTWLAAIYGHQQSTWVQLTILISFAFLVPFYLWQNKLFNPWRTLSILFAKVGKNTPKLYSWQHLLSILSYDHFRHARWWKGTPQNHRIAGLGFLCVVLFRFSQLAINKGWPRVARLIWQFNLLLTKADIRPETDIGPGLLLDNPVAIGISPGVGKDATLMSHSGIGRSGKRSVGKGPGYPNVGDGVFLGPRACVLGGFEIPSGTVFPAHHQVISLSDLKQLNLGDE